MLEGQKFQKKSVFFNFSQKRFDILQNDEHIFCPLSKNDQFAALINIIGILCREQS